jgi:hypothetical protein
MVPDVLSPVVHSRKLLLQYSRSSGSRGSAVGIATGYGLDVRSRDSAVGIATGYGLDVRSRDSAVGIATGYELDVRSRDSAVGIATGYGLEYRGVGVRVPIVSRIFSSPRRPNRLRGPPYLLSNGYRGFFSRG